MLQRNRVVETTTFKSLIIAGAVIGFGICASAQDNDTGKMEYQSSCAACHGIDAKGGGPVSKELKTPPADLTVLAKHNNGVFPSDRVFQIIDGRQSAATALVKCRFGDTGSDHHKHIGLKIACWRWSIT
jgi:mono/diheme cytochrome c family protein